MGDRLFRIFRNEQRTADLKGQVVVNLECKRRKNVEVAKSFFYCLSEYFWHWNSRTQTNSSRFSAKSHNLMANWPITDQHWFRGAVCPSWKRTSMRSKTSTSCPCSFSRTVFCSTSRMILKLGVETLLVWMLRIEWITSLYRGRFVVCSLISDDEHRLILRAPHKMLLVQTGFSTHMLILYKLTC